MMRRELKLLRVSWRSRGSAMGQTCAQSEPRVRRVASVRDWCRLSFETFRAESFPGFRGQLKVGAEHDSALWNPLCAAM